MTKTKDGWRVVYGEQRPAWEKIFPTKREAEAFAREHRSFGDIIFSIAKVIPGEPPRSLFGAIGIDVAAFTAGQPSTEK